MWCFASSLVEVCRRHFHAFTTCWKRAREVLRKTEFLSFQYQVYCKLFKAEDKFFRCRGSKKRNHLVTDHYIKPIDAHQYLYASSCHVFHFKKSIHYSQTLRLNRVCSETSFFDKRCTGLLIWLTQGRFSDKLVRKQILKAMKFSSKELLKKQGKKESEPKPVINISYHPSLAQLKNIMTRIHLLLTPDNEYSKMLGDVNIIGFCRGKNWRISSGEQKYLKLKTRVGVALAKDLDVKFANMFYHLGILHHFVKNAHMSLDQRIWITDLRM